MRIRLKTQHCRRKVLQKVNPTLDLSGVHACANILLFADVIGIDVTSCDVIRKQINGDVFSDVKLRMTFYAIKPFETFIVDIVNFTANTLKHLKMINH